MGRKKTKQKKTRKKRCVQKEVYMGFGSIVGPDYLYHMPPRK